jgi:chromosomal replication initiator protein
MPYRGALNLTTASPSESGGDVIAESSADIVTRLSDQLSRRIGRRKYNLWFDQTRFHVSDSQVTLTAPNRFAADWIADHFRADLSDTVREELGEPIDVAIDIDAGAGKSHGRSDAGESNAPASVPAAKPAAAKPSSTGSTKMRHRLDDFVVGACNELAYRTAVRLIDHDQRELTPLFIHGGCGVGKTHLLQGICRRFADFYPGRRWRYTSAEQFTNAYVTAVKNNALGVFRKKLRGLDLLAVDDVHFLSNKSATQNEFLHTFNSMDLGGAKLLLASDSHPKMIEQFSDALISRFVSGMVVRIDSPDPDTRRQLVERIAQRRGLSLMDSVAPEIAARCTGSVREIEGMLTTLEAMAALDSSDGGATAGNTGSGRRVVIGHALVNRLLGASRTMRPVRPIRFAAIVDTVCAELHVQPTDLRGTSRHRQVVLARSLVVHLARRLTTMSYPDIARQLGKRNHSTVVTAAKRIDKQIAGHQQVTLMPDLRQITVDRLAERLHDAVVRGDV